MIVVDITIHPHGAPPPEGQTDWRRARVQIWNAGRDRANGTADYLYQVVEGDAPDHPHWTGRDKVLARGGVENFPRPDKQEHLMRLLTAVLIDAGDVDLPPLER